MKRRILSLLISLALCVGLCPAAVLAEEEQPAEPTQTVEGETGEKEPEDTDTAENTPGGGITEEKPEIKPEEPENPEIKPEEPEDTETNPETPGETETKPETPENPEESGDTETKPETPEETETKPEENEEKLETVEKGLSKFRAMRASTESSSIQILPSGFVFAQGVPIVISENEGITSIYDEEGNLLSGTTDVSTFAIYGGWFVQDGSTHKDSPSVVMESGTVAAIYGGNYAGELEGNPVVTVKSGTVNYICGGGAKSNTNGDTCVTIEGGTVTYVYGGGEDGSVNNTHIQLMGGQCTYLYGGSNNYSGLNDVVVEHATVEIGVDCNPLGWVSAGGYNDTTEEAQVIIHNYKTDNNKHINIDATTAQNATVIVQRDDRVPHDENYSYDFDLCLVGTWNVVVEYGEVTIMATEGESKNLELDSLEIQENGKVTFQDWDTVQIQELSGNGGQLLFPAQFLSGTSNIVNKPVTVGNISVEAPLIIKAEGNGWTDEKLEEFYFLDGTGIDVLTSTDCFFSEGYEVVQREIPNKSGAKGIYLQQKRAEEPVYISKLEFNQNPVTYNETIPLTVGVAKQLATADQLEVIPNAHIQIRGNNNQDVLFATIQVNDTGTKATITGVDGISREVEITGGYINFDLPVNANLLNTCEEGLKMIATAPEQYSSTAQLIGPNGETKITVNPASIALQGTIPEPIFQESTDVEWSEDGAFYTASVQWRLSDGTTTDTFQMNRDYQADIILTPKSGHWLNEKAIGNKITYGGQERDCIFNSDGTVTLKNMSSKRFDGYTVTITASPEEGGTVDGANTYLSGSEVTVTASPYEGYLFVGWKENDKIVSAVREYTFTVENNRTLTAVFALEEGGIKLKVDELAKVPDGLKGKPEFNTVEKIKEKLRTKVTLAMSDPNAQIAYYDVRLQYLENGVWKDVDPDKFPVGGVVAVLSYPSGTNGTDYTFTVQHMISHGDRAGNVETLSYTAVSRGLQCTFTSLSPVAVGYKLKEKTPAPSTPSTPGTLFTDSSSDDDEEEAPDPEYDFWQTVREQIKKAKSGDTVKVNARGYDRMPASVMDALKKSNNVTLRIRWSGGEEIVIPSAKALSEPLRIYYPLSYLAKYDFGEPAVPEAPDHLNPATGGDIEVEAPLTAEAPLDTAGEPLVTDSRRGLAETEEQAEKGIEKAIPGVYEPEAPAATSIEPAVSGQPEADRGGSGILPLVLALVAAAICGGVWVWRNKREWFEGLRNPK